MDVAWTAASNGERGIGTVFVGAGGLGFALSGWATLDVAWEATSNEDKGLCAGFEGAGGLVFAWLGWATLEVAREATSNEEGAREEVLVCVVFLGVTTV